MIVDYLMKFEILDLERKAWIRIIVVNNIIITNSYCY